MAATTDRVITPKFDKQGVVSYPSITSPPNDSFAICYMVPDRIIPVIFVPGVMGSNLGKNIDKKKPPAESVWLLNSDAAMAKSWATKGPEYRKDHLRPENTDVFRDGSIPQGTIQADTELKRRGWGEVGFGSYAETLVWLENTLNDYNDVHNGQRVGLIGQALEGAVKMDKVAREEIALTYKYRFPVHAVGYNWLESNAVSAERLKAKINEFITFYQKNFKCEQVIVVTHSMGGLVARHCSENLGMQGKILGIVHGVMPATGAAAVYRRMKAGTENPDQAKWNAAYFEGAGASAVLGGNAAEMTAVLSSAPGPLQLLPSVEYGMNWLKFHDGKNELTPMSLPKADPYSEIYTVRGKWWSLCDDALIDPRDEKKERIDGDWNKFATLIREKVKDFLENEIKGKYHPHTYAFIGIDPAKPAYGQVQWRHQPGSNYSNAPLPKDLLNASFRRGQGEGYELPIRPNRPASFMGQPLQPSLMPMQISTPEEAGDGTVPRRSGQAVKGHAKAYFELLRVGHEPAYKNANTHAQRAALYGIVKIAQRIKDVAGMAYP